MPTTIPTTDDLRAVVRDELIAFFSTFQIPTHASGIDDDDIIRGVEKAAQFTGKAPSTIYARCSQRTIPHSKQGKDLYFSKRELRHWMLTEGKRRTVSEIQNQTI